MKKINNKLLVRSVSLLIVSVMFLSSCKQPKTVSKTESKPNFSVSDVSSNEEPLPSDNNTTSTNDKSGVPNNSKVSNTVSSNSPTVDKAIVDGKITKPDSGAFTSKKGTLTGKNNKITEFKLLTDKLVAFELVEFQFVIPNLPSDLNVYKEEDLDVTINLVGSNGKTIVADAFYYEEYGLTDTKQLANRTESKPCFRFRVSTQGGGTWDFTVTLALKGKVVDELKGYINVDSNKKGSQLLKVEPKRKQTFITASGEDYVPIGQNLAWNSPIGKKSSFGQYIGNQMKVMSEYGANYARIWDYLDSGSKIKIAVNEMSQGASAMWDYIFQLAEDTGVYVSFVLINHGEISQTNADASFDRTCWHVNNGGYLTDATKFFTDRKTIEAFKTYVRYIVSRWGYSEYVMTWEICNEIDHAYGPTQLPEVRAWLKEIAEYLRKIDPYRHMVSNSTGYQTNPLATYNIFDFIYFHLYNYESVESVANLLKTTWLTYNRPVILGEWGLFGDLRDLVGGSITDDLTIIHHGNWAALMGGSAGTAMNWWWEALDKVGGQWMYQVPSEIAKEIPWSDPNMFMVNTTSVSPSNKQIQAMGYRGQDYAYIWFYDGKFHVKNRVETTFKNETAKVKIDDGTYHVRWVNTWTGVSIKKEVLSTNDGYLQFELPEWSKDVVVAITVD